MSCDELQSVGSYDDRSRQSSLASLADDLTKRGTYNHRLGIGLDRALGQLHGKSAGDDAPAGSGAKATTAENASKFLSTAAATASGAASGFGSFKVPIQQEEDARGRRLDSLAEAPDDAEDDALGQPEAGVGLAMAPPDPPTLQARVHIPDFVSDSDADRGQWLKRQSQSRRQKRRGSGSGKRASSSSSSAATFRTRSGNAFESSPRSSRESSLAGDDSDASSVASTSSRLSIVSTPEVSLHHRHLLQQRFKSRPSGGDRPASVVGVVSGGGGGNSALSRNLSASSLPGGRPRGSLSRTSSSSSISSMVSVSTSLLRWCSVCEAEFTRLRRPHRCRRCLEAVCAPCSPARLPVPGSGSAELKRSCKLCAGDNTERPQIDVVASPPRGAGAAVPAPASAGRVTRGAGRRSASMSSIARAPFGVLSKAASAVAAGFYPAAAAAPADGATADGAEGANGGESSGRRSVDGSVDEDEDDEDVFYLPQGVPVAGSDSLNAGLPSAGAGAGAEGSEGESFGTPPDVEAGMALAGANGKAAALPAAMGAALEKKLAQHVAGGAEAVAGSTPSGVLSTVPDGDAPSTDASTPVINRAPGADDGDTPSSAVPDVPSTESQKSKRGGLFGFLRPVLGRRRSSDGEQSRSADASASSTERPPDTAAAGDATVATPSSASVGAPPPPASPPSLEARSVASTPGPREPGEAEAPSPSAAGDVGADATKMVEDMVSATATVAESPASTTATPESASGRRGLFGAAKTPTSTTTTPESARSGGGLFSALFSRPMSMARGEEPELPVTVTDSATLSTPDVTSVPEVSTGTPSPGVQVSAPGGDADSPTPPAVADTVAADQAVDDKDGAPTSLVPAAAPAAASAERGADESEAVTGSIGISGLSPETVGDAPVPLAGDSHPSGGSSPPITPAATGEGGADVAPSMGVPSGEVDGPVPPVGDSLPAADVGDVGVDLGAKVGDATAAATEIPDTLPSGGVKLQTGPLDVGGPSAEAPLRQGAEVELPDSAVPDAPAPGAPGPDVSGPSLDASGDVTAANEPVTPLPTVYALEPAAEGEPAHDPPPVEGGTKTFAAPSNSVAAQLAQEAQQPSPSAVAISPTTAISAPDQRSPAGAAAASGATLHIVPSGEDFDEAIAPGGKTGVDLGDAEGHAAAGGGGVEIADVVVGGGGGGGGGGPPPQEDSGSPAPSMNQAGSETTGLVLMEEAVKKEGAGGGAIEFVATATPPAAVQPRESGEDDVAKVAAEVGLTAPAPQAEEGAVQPNFAAEVKGIDEMPALDGAVVPVEAEAGPVAPDTPAETVADTDQRGVGVDRGEASLVAVPKGVDGKPALVEVAVPVEAKAVVDPPAAPAKIETDTDRRSVGADLGQESSAAAAPAATVAAAAAAAAAAAGGGIQEQREEKPDVVVATAPKAVYETPAGYSGARIPVSTMDGGVLYGVGSTGAAVPTMEYADDSAAESIVSPVGGVLVPGTEAADGQPRPEEEKLVGAPALVPAVEVGAGVPDLAAGAAIAGAGGAAAAVTNEVEEKAAAAPAVESFAGLSVEDEPLEGTVGPELGGAIGAAPYVLEDDGGGLFASPAAGVDEALYPAGAAEEAVVVADDDARALLPASGVDDAVQTGVAGVFLDESLLVPAAGVDDDGGGAATSAADATSTLVVTEGAISGTAGHMLLSAASADGKEWVVAPPVDEDLAEPPVAAGESLADEGQAAAAAAANAATKAIGPAAGSGNLGQNEPETPSSAGTEGGARRGGGEDLASDAGRVGGSVAVEGGGGTAFELETTSSPMVSQSTKGNEEEGEGAGRDAVIEKIVKESSLERGDGARSEGAEAAAGAGAALAEGADAETAAGSPGLSSSTAVISGGEKLAAFPSDAPVAAAAAPSPGGNTSAAAKQAEGMGHGNRNKATPSYDKIWDSSEVRRDEEYATAAAAAAAAAATATGLAAATSSSINPDKEFPTEEKMPPPPPPPLQGGAAWMSPPAERGAGNKVPPSTPTDRGSARWAPARNGTKGGVGRDAGASSIGGPKGVPMPFSSGSGGAERIGASPRHGTRRHSSASSASASSQRRGGATGAGGAGGACATADAAGEERDWLDELIDLFVDRCSTCVADDAGH